MRIGIVDDMFFSLQGELANRGHQVFAYCGFSKLQPDGTFDISKHDGAGSITQVQSHMALLNLNCDLYICGTTNYNDINGYEYFRQVGKPVIGHSTAAIMLETDRNYSKYINNMLGLDSKLLLTPATYSFTTVEGAVEFLKETTHNWVVKQHPSSPQHVMENRTWLSMYGSHEATISLLESPNAWFYETGSGGVILEEYIKGQEVSFGAWFDGNDFIGPLYSYIEHKGAQNGDRGNMLTGEVGSTMSFHTFDSTTKVTRIFNLLTPFLKGKCNGMVDINTIMTEDGNLHFIEYTIRWGRPTLEIQLAMLYPGLDYGNILMQLAKGTHGNHILNHSYRYNLKATAVTVFSYGIPFIKQYDPDGSTCLSHRYKFRMPEYDGTTSDVRQLFAAYDNELDNGTWRTAPSDRQFTVIGRGETCKESIEAAYKVLDGFNLPTCTWRDDVGHNFEQCELDLKKHHIV